MKNTDPWRIPGREVRENPQDAVAIERGLRHGLLRHAPLGTDRPPRIALETPKTALSRPVSASPDDAVRVAREVDHASRCRGVIPDPSVL